MASLVYVRLFMLNFYFFLVNKPLVRGNTQVNVVSDDVLKDLIQKESFLLVYFLHNTCDESCQQYTKELEAVRQDSFIQGLKIVKALNSDLSDRYGIKDEATLTFFRSSYPVIYKSKSIQFDDVIIWLEHNREVSTVRLNDDTFEHDTQAGTGATTGDWFIMFYKDTCNELIAIWETLCLDLKHRMNVATVDTDKSPMLAKRFGIKKCPTIYFFRHGKMFEYDMEHKNLRSFMRFIDGWYRNTKGYRVPSVPTPFDRLVDAAVTGLEDALSGKPSQTTMVVGSSIVFMFILLIFWLLNNRKRGFLKKE